MDWLIAGVFLLIGLVGVAVIWIGRKNPRLKPHNPGFVRYSGAFGLGHPTDEKPKSDSKSESKQARNEGRPPE